MQVSDLMSASILRISDELDDGMRRAVAEEMPEYGAAADRYNRRTHLQHQRTQEIVFCLKLLGLKQSTMPLADV